MKIDPNEPAYPVAESEYMHYQTGLSIRTELAARAMQGLLAACSDAESDFPTAISCAGLSLEYADALIEALNKGENNGKA